MRMEKRRIAISDSPAGTRTLALVKCRGVFPKVGVADWRTWLGSWRCGPRKCETELKLQYRLYKGFIKYVPSRAFSPLSFLDNATARDKTRSLLRI